VRCWVRQMIAPAAVVGLFVIGYYFAFYPSLVHQRWYRAVEYRILSLAERRPDDVDAKQWAACLHWTWNLHGNHGGITYFDARARYPFLGEFDRQLKGRVDLSTIDWIWDQYVLHTSGGRSYSDHYRPTTADRLKEASVDPYGENNLDGWIEWLNRRRATEE
jgi:hypothetical protein